jgi:hypothetical protein
VVLAADPALQAYVQALLADEVKVAGGKAFIVRDGKATDAATGAAARCPRAPKTWSTTTACAASWKPRWRR